MIPMRRILPMFIAWAQQHAFSSASATFSAHACSTRSTYRAVDERPPLGVLSRLNWQRHPLKVSSPTLKRSHTMCNFLIFTTVLSDELHSPFLQHITIATIILVVSVFLKNLLIIYK